MRSFILYQTTCAQVTQPLLLEPLRELGVDLSAGQLSALITTGQEAVHLEQEALLQARLQRCGYLHANEPGARHLGKNGYCTPIGNEVFAWFASTDSKSRINFPGLLRAGCDACTVNDQALAYLAEQRVPQALASTDPRPIRIATAGALLGTVIEQGVAPDLAIISAVRCLAARLVLGSCRTGPGQTRRLQRCATRG
ncbi:MAG: hypothetical protein ACREVZ_13285, partial [Burkholderiales bacterium]